MKKSLVAVAVLTAFAGSAFAANVTLYGVLDYSLLYTSVDSDDGAGSVDKLQMKSGNQAGSRWGLKGTEKINDDLSVGFILESGFTADDGAVDDTSRSRLFRREASLSLSGSSWGKLTFGRFGAANQGVSSWGKASMLSAFGTSWSATYAAQASQVLLVGSVYDNMIGYQTPTFAGFTGLVQYSMDTGTKKTSAIDSNDVENTSTVDRYGLIGATYSNGPLNVALIVDWTNNESVGYDSTNKVATFSDPDDSYTVTLGGNYNFGPATVYLAAQYFDNKSPASSSTLVAPGYIDGYSVLLSASAPVCGGKLMVGIGYLDAESHESADDIDYKRYVASIGYDYSLSKRTNVYTVLGYQKEELKEDGDKTKPDAIGFTVGIRHRF